MLFFARKHKAVRQKEEMRRKACFPEHLFLLA